MSKENPHQEQVEYRNSPILYLAYASQLGEAFRYVIGHQIVRCTYAVAIGYILADTFTKSEEEYKQQKIKNYKKVLFVGMDTFLWQAFASVILPSFALQKTSAFFYNRLYMLPSLVRNLTVAGLGIMTIPIIVRPIDDFVDNVLDITIRKYIPP